MNATPVLMGKGAEVVSSKTKISLNALMVAIARLSYMAVKFYTRGQHSFERWSWVKGKLNRYLNILVFNYLASSSFKLGELDLADRQQFLLDAVSNVVLLHFKQRQKIYRYSQKRRWFRKETFVVLSIAALYYHLLLRCIKGVMRLGSCYESSFKNIETVDVAIGFPEHAFSVAPAGYVGDWGGALPSFGEFLSRTCKDSLVVSLDEYTRLSKRKEGAEGEAASGLMARVRPSRKKTLWGATRRSPFLISVFVRMVGGALRFTSELPLVLQYYTMWAKSYRYREFFLKLRNQNHRVRHIYLMPFSDSGLLKYDSQFRALVRTYSYSCNFLIPPVNGHYDCGGSQMCASVDDILSDTPLAAFQTGGCGVGFTQIYEHISLMKQAINERFKCAFRYEAQPSQWPLMLGFESFDEGAGFGDNEWVAVFDVPPENKESQLAYSLVGDMASNFEVVAEFLSDTIGACIRAGYRVAVKPKYSLTNYSHQYQAFVNSLRSEYGDHVLVLNPYTSMIPFLASVKACISFPFTSTKIVAQVLGRPSIYYMPNQYRTSFTRKARTRNPEMVFGRADLSVFLASIATENDKRLSHKLSLTHKFGESYG